MESFIKTEEAYIVKDLDIFLDQKFIWEIHLQKTTGKNRLTFWI